MRSRSVLFALLPLVAIVALDAPVFAQLNQSWVSRYNNGLVIPAADNGNKLVVDSSGNSYVAGSSGGGSVTNLVLIKYAGDGTALWTNRYQGPYRGVNVAMAVALDNLGNVCVAGYSQGAGGLPDFVTLKYNVTNGVPAWTNRFDGPINGDDQPRALGVDGAGNVYVAGFSQGTGTSYDYLAIKYSSAGVPLWTNRYNGPGNSSDQANAMFVDGSGNVYVTGGSAGIGTGNDYATIKYDTSGNAVWTNRYYSVNGTSSNRVDNALAVTVDGSGNVYVAGAATVTNTSSDYLTIKYNSSGVPLWTNRYNGPGNGTDQPIGVAVDGAGNVFITGFSYGGAFAASDFATVKLNSSGVPLWTNRFDSANGSADDQPRALVLDAVGDVYVSGYSENALGGGDYRVAKISSVAGTNVWVAYYNGPSGGTDTNAALALDGSGNVYVTGTAVSGTGQDITTIKYSPAGQQQWVSTFNDFVGGTDEVVAMATDSEGSVYLAGKSAGLGTGVDFVIVKQNAYGTGIWTNRFNGAGNGDDLIAALAVDRSGNVHVTGQSDGDYVTIKYAINGAGIWTNRYSGPSGGADVPAGLVLDTNSNVYVTGSSTNASGNSDYLTIKYSTTGAGMWTNRYDGLGAGDDQAVGIALDGSGNVYVTGSSMGSTSGSDYATVKINGATGANIWVARYDGPVSDYDFATALTVDGSGNVIVTGHSIGSNFYDDYATLKYSSNGTPQWTNRYDGPVNNDDVARAVAVDTNGNVYVTGYSYGSDPLSIFPGSVKDYATIKYAANGTPQWTNRFDGPAGTLNDDAFAMAVDGAGNVFVTGSSESLANGKDMLTVMYNSSGVPLSTNRYNGLGSGNDAPAAMVLRGRYDVLVSGKSLGAAGDYDFATVLYYQTNAANAAPVANSQTVNTTEDFPINITLTGSDANGDPLQYIIISGPTNGTLGTLAPSLFYSPRAGFTGSDAIRFRISDGLLESAIATVTINVTSINDPPVMTAFYDVTLVGNAGRQTLSFNVSEPANETNQIITVTASSSSPALIPNPNVNYTTNSGAGSLSFTPVANAYGSALITVTASDNGGTLNGGVDHATQTFRVTVYRPVVSQPVDNFLVANGAISALLETNNVLYIGGSFTELGTNSGRATTFYQTNGAPVPGYPMVDRVVNSVIPDGAGGWYLGGDFTTVGGQPRFRVAHVLTNGVVDAGFRADFDAVVNALVVSSTNLYVGGSFIRMSNYSGGVLVSTNSRYRFAVLDAATGALRTNAAGNGEMSFQNTISALLVDSNSSTLYVGGSYANTSSNSIITNVAGGVTNYVTNVIVFTNSITNVIWAGLTNGTAVRYSGPARMAAVDLTSGFPSTNFVADVDNQVLALAMSGTNLYVGGSFTSITNSASFTNRFRLSRLHPTSGAVAATFRANLNNTARALVVSGTNLFVGGDFTGLTNVIVQTNRNRLCALNASNGVARAWDPNLNNIVRSLAVMGTNVFAGGDFTTVNSNTVPRRRLAAFGTNVNLVATNIVVSPFAPNPSDFVAALAAANGIAYVGGNFTFYNGMLRSRAAAINLATGALTPWDPSPNNTVLALASMQTNIVLGGSFTLTRSSTPFNGFRFAIVDTNTGSMNLTYTNCNFDNNVNALAYAGSTLYIGGSFAYVTNQSRGGIDDSRIGLAAIDVGNRGALLTNFVADVNLGASVSALAVISNSLYVGGSFTNIGGVNKYRLAALDAGSAAIQPGFMANADNTVLTLFPQGGGLFVGGSFANVTNVISGTTNFTGRGRLMSIDPVSGNAGGWNPNVNNNSVRALAAIGTNIYVGGDFNGAIGATNRNRLGEVSSTTALATGWNPDLDNTVNAIAAKDGRVYAGGAFTVSGGLTGNGRPRTFLAMFDALNITNNVAPTFDPLPNLTINEDAPLTNIAVTGILAGPPSESSQTLTLTATSSNPGLIPNPTVTYSSPAPTGAFSFAPLTNASGSAIITIVLTDSGGTANGGVDSVTNTFSVTVNQVNDAPTLDPIASITINEDANFQTVTLSNITVGVTNEASQQSFTVTAVSSDVTLIPTPTVSYSSQYTTGTLTFAPVANAFGTATISVIVTDNGGTANGGVNAVTNTFTVTVLPSNDPPTMNTIPGRTFNEDSVVSTNINFAGVSPGLGETNQTLTITASSSNPGLIPNPAVTYTNGNATGFVTLLPVANGNGAATITIVLRDDGGTVNGGRDATTNQFTVVVNAVNDPPTFNALSSLTINEDTPTVVNLGGISSGPANEISQTMSVAAFSSDTSLIPNPTSGYTPGATTGTISFTPVTNASGSAIISVVVTDSGGTANGGINAATNTFTVTVTAVNDPPTLNTVGNLTLNEDAGLQTINLGGITVGPNETGQAPITISVFSSDTNVVPHPAITYTSPNTTGSIVFTPVTNANGTVTISIVLRDTGGTANGGVDSATNTFTVTINPVNDVPTLNALANQTLNEDGGTQTVNLTGITAGPANESAQTLTVSVISSDTNLLAVTATNYTSPNTTGSLSFRPVNDASGTALVTVVFKDTGGTVNGGVDSMTNTFTVTVNPVNDAPTLSAIGNLTISQDAAQQAVSLGGISTGPANESAQTLSLAATSSNPSLISTPVVGYTNGNANGALTFTPSPGVSGAATIIVVVTDSGGTANGGVNAVTNTFTVTVVSSVTPSLTISRSGAGVLVSWPTNNAGFTLQSTPDLSSSWIDVGTAPSVVSGQYVLTNNPAVSNRFYRLRKP